MCDVQAPHEDELCSGQRSVVRRRPAPPGGFINAPHCQTPFSSAHIHKTRQLYELRSAASSQLDQLSFSDFNSFTPASAPASASASAASTPGTLLVKTGAGTCEM